MLLLVRPALPAADARATWASGSPISLPGSFVGALDDLFVLDFTGHIAGPYATKLLADLGARVIKVERPGRGDASRDIGPFLGDQPGPDRSATFQFLETTRRAWH